MDLKNKNKRIKGKKKKRKKKDERTRHKKPVADSFTLWHCSVDQVVEARVRRYCGGRGGGRRDGGLFAIVPWFCNSKRPSPRTVQGFVECAFWSEDRASHRASAVSKEGERVRIKGSKKKSKSKKKRKLLSSNKII